MFIFSSVCRRLLQSMKNVSGKPNNYRFNLTDGEIILDSDTKSVMQHNGTSTKPG